MERKRHTFTVYMQSERGDTSERQVHAYWDPAHEGTEGAVKGAARAAAYMDGGKKTKYEALSHKLVA